MSANSKVIYVNCSYLSTNQSQCQAFQPPCMYISTNFKPQCVCGGQSIGTSERCFACNQKSEMPDRQKKTCICIEGFGVDKEGDDLCKPCGPKTYTDFQYVMQFDKKVPCAACDAIGRVPSVYIAPSYSGNTACFCDKTKNFVNDYKSINEDCKCLDGYILSDDKTYCYNPNLPPSSNNNSQNNSWNNNNNKPEYNENNQQGISAGSAIVIAIIILLALSFVAIGVSIMKKAKRSTRTQQALIIETNELE